MSKLLETDLCEENIDSQKENYVNNGKYPSIKFLSLPINLTVFFLRFLIHTTLITKLSYLLIFLDFHQKNQDIVSDFDTLSTKPCLLKNDLSYNSEHAKSFSYYRSFLKNNQSNQENNSEILKEQESRITKENALNSKRIADPSGHHNFQNQINTKKTNLDSQSQQPKKYFDGTDNKNFQEDKWKTDVQNFQSSKMKIKKNLMNFSITKNSPVLPPQIKSKTFYTSCNTPTMTSNIPNNIFKVSFFSFKTNKPY